jgi:hypothetical protein
MDISKYNKYFRDYNDTSKYKLGKTYKYNLEKSYIKLYYNDRRMIFQTPGMYIPYKPRKNSYSSKNNYTIDMSFFNEGIDKDLPEYEKWFYELEKTVYRLLRKRSYLRANKTGFKTLFRGDDYRYTKKMSISFSDKETSFFMLENVGGISRSKPIDEITFPCYGFFIMEVQTIWLNKPSGILGGSGKDVAPNWGIKLAVHAVQCIPNHNQFSSFGKIAFIPSNTFKQPTNPISSTIPPPPPPPPPGLFNSAIPPPPPPLPSNLALKPSKSEIPAYLAKFFSMLKMGIPREAVKHKMKMAGLSGDLLDNPHSTTSNSISNNTNDTNTSAGPVKITADMLGAVSLKKTVRESPEERKRRLAKEKAKASSGGAGFEVSLDAVLSMRASLRKTGVDTKKRIEKDHYKQYTYNNNLSDSDEEC